MITTTIGQIEFAHVAQLSHYRGRGQDQAPRSPEFRLTGGTGEMNAIVNDPGRWKPGVSGNVNGRPVGARGHFSEEVLRTLRKVFAIEGETAMIRTAKENPSAFTAICARLLPSEVTAIIAQTSPHLDQDDLQVLRLIKAALPNAGDREPGFVLNFVLDAVRAHGAKLIDARENETRGQSD